MLTQRYNEFLGEWFHHDTTNEDERKKEVAHNRFMEANENFMLEAAEQFYLSEVRAGRMKEKVDWFHPLFENIYELMERLGIKDHVMATLDAQFEIEYEFQQHQEMLKAVMDEEVRLNLIPPFQKKAWVL